MFDEPLGIQRRDGGMNRQGRENGVELYQGMGSNQSLICSIGHTLELGQTLFMSRVGFDHRGD